MKMFKNAVLWSRASRLHVGQVMNLEVWLHAKTCTLPLLLHFKNSYLSILYQVLLFKFPRMKINCSGQDPLNYSDTLFRN